MSTYIVKVILSSATTVLYDEYTLEDVIMLEATEKGYYYLKTKDGSDFRFPINYTILEKKVKKD